MTFNELYTKYRSYVKKSAYSQFHNEERAEDAAQDFYLWLHKNLSKYDSERSTFKKWFIANMKFSFQNTRKKSFTSGVLKPIDDTVQVANIEDVVIWCKNSRDEDIREAINLAAGKIKPKDLVILQKVVLEGETLTEVAKTLGVTKQRAEQIHKQALIRLKSLLERGL